MSSSDAVKAFRRAYGGSKNFMTPNVIACERRGKHYVELSTGDSIAGSGQIYGVTVISANTGAREHDLSKCFGSLHEASQYMDELGRKS